MAELNKDGLIVGQEVDFTTIMRINRERKQEGVKNDNTDKPEVRDTGNSDVSVVQKTARPKKTKKSQSQFYSQLPLCD